MAPEDVRAREFNAAQIAEIIATGYRGPVYTTHADGSIEEIGCIDGDGVFRSSGGDEGVEKGEGR